MSHEFDSGVFRNEPFWHRLGEVHIVSEEGELDWLTAYRKSGLNRWTVEVKPAGVEVEPGVWMYLPDDRATVRVNDDGSKVPFKAVGTKYTEIQNVKAFDFLRHLTDSDDLAIESAISLRGGRVVVVQARRPDHIDVGDGQTILPYISAVTSHDGSLPVKLFYTPIRTGCANTLSYSLSELDRSARQSYNIRHTRNHEVKLEEARHALEMSFNYTDTLAIVGDQMLHTSFSDGEFQDFLDSLLPIPEEQGRGQTMRTSAQEAITELYYGPEERQINGTTWGALMAVSEYSEHGTTVRNPDSRYERIMRGDALNQQAFDLLKPEMALEDGPSIDVQIGHLLS